MINSTLPYLLMPIIIHTTPALCYTLKAQNGMNLLSNYAELFFR
jgi:hypothetical protein